MKVPERKVNPNIKVSNKKPSPVLGLKFYQSQYRGGADILRGLSPNFGPSRGYDITMTMPTGEVLFKSINEEMFRNISELRTFLLLNESRRLALSWAEFKIRIEGYTQKADSPNKEDVWIPSRTLSTKHIDWCVTAYYGKRRSHHRLLDGETINGQFNKTFFRTMHMGDDEFYYRDIDRRDATNRWHLMSADYEFKMYHLITEYFETTPEADALWFEISQILMQLAAHTGMTTTKLLHIYKAKYFKKSSTLLTTVQLNRLLGYLKEDLDSSPFNMPSIGKHIRDLEWCASCHTHLDKKRLSKFEKLLYTYRALFEEDDFETLLLACQEDMMSISLIGPFIDEMQQTLLALYDEDLYTKIVGEPFNKFSDDESIAAKKKIAEEEAVAAQMKKMEEYYAKRS